MTGSSAAPSISHSTLSPESMPRLRPELQMTLHESNGKTFCLVEDPISNSFFRIGRPEWTFASQLDGKTAPQLAYQRTIEAVGHGNFSPLAAGQMLQWLVSNRLVRTGQPQLPVAQPGTVSRLLMGLFFSKIPLCHPDRQLAKLEPYARWCFSWPAFLLWCLLIGYASFLVAGDWNRFCASATSYLSPRSWIYLLVAWLILKAIHECFHGLACKRFGGSVGACGIVFILLSPIAFVDVSSAWRFRSKWQRIVTSAAGMYAEFAIAAMAAIIWSGTRWPAIAFACHSIVVAASVSSLLFNANPLMRFDGYYILADLLEIENLYVEGRQAVRSALRRHFLGLKTPTRLRSRRDAVVIAIYGIAAAMWRILVCVSLILGAAALFHGAGLVVAAAGVFFWFAVPVFNFVRFIVKGNAGEQPAKARCLIAATCVGVLLVTVLYIPIPGGVNAPAIVHFEPLHDLRSESDGFVQRVHVRSGDKVTAGQVLVTLENDELLAETKMVAAETKQSLIQARIYRSDQEYPKYQTELKRHEALTERLENLCSRADHLVVRAPAAGKVITRNVDQLEGQYVKAGQRLLSIAAEDSKEIDVTIPEYHIEAFLAKVGQHPTVMLDGALAPVRDAILTSVDPGATATLRHPVLGANQGGPLPVQPEYASDEGESVESRYRLTAPRFYGSLQIPPDVAETLKAGTIGQVRFTDRSETMGRKLRRLADRWIGLRLPGS
jgi:putative peptide zinc metalloprotease protein